MPTWMIQEILDTLAESGVRVEVRSANGHWAKGKFYCLPSRPKGKWIFAVDEDHSANRGICYAVFDREVITIELHKRIVNLKGVLI